MAVAELTLFSAGPYVLFSRCHTDDNISFYNFELINTVEKE